ncbi:MAG: nucleotidyltransferase domain-containing protein [Bacteroidales bacterium]|nr:nucleotidyltransferase domain-containing protein [Bacteroidales bacterium]MCD8394649.1 nucleotidyltransferase domain-containing protein [Bacteroidales bacterium]
MKRPEAVEKIRQTIRSVAPNAEIILYGSEARGDAREDSDFDVLILEDTDKISVARQEEFFGQFCDLLLSDGIMVSPYLTTKKEWENRPFKTPFYCNVMNEGIRL